MRGAGRCVVRAGLLGGLIAALSGLAPARADEWSKTYKIVSPPELRVETNDANVTIAGWERAECEVRVTTTGWKISDQDVRVLDSHTANLLELQVLAPKLKMSFGRRGIKVEIHAPKEVNTEVNAGLGNISLTGLKGKTVLTSKTGNIDALELDGKLEANTGEGRVRARGRLDLVTVRSGFGGVDLAALAGSKMVSQWRVNTDDGNIILHLPAGFGADLDAQTESGRITVEFPYTITGTPDQSVIRGKMNGGGERLVLRTSGGNIKVLRD